MINATNLLMALRCLGLVYMSFCGELCIYVEVEYLSMGAISNTNFVF
jgi:hypothetical protein